MAATGVIYSLVSRGRETILSDFSAFSGNFELAAQDILGRTNLSKTFGQFATNNYCFFTFVKDGYVFLVMVDSSYETRIAVSFLKKIQQEFFKLYSPQQRSTAIAHSLKDFRKTLKESMLQYNDKTKVDKLSELKKELTELQEISLKNMDKVIERGEKIQHLVAQSQAMSETSFDMKKTAKGVKDAMWWKNKKVLIGIIGLVLIVIGIVVLIIVV